MEKRVKIEALRIVHTKTLSTTCPNKLKKRGCPQMLKTASFDKGSFFSALLSTSLFYYF
jgi:hypothetical protein